MKIAWTLLLHLVGLACIAADIVIVATVGSLDIHWSGWLAVGFFGVLAMGVATGWVRIRKRPLTIIALGVYVMSAIALLGFGFSINDPLRPSLVFIATPLLIAVFVRLIYKIVTHRRTPDEPEPAAKPSTHDSIF
jgi:hypothetical protein